MFLELIFAECNRGPALTNLDTATIESEDEPPCKVPALFDAYSKTRKNCQEKKGYSQGTTLKLLRFDYSYQYVMSNRSLTLPTL